MNAGPWPLANIWQALTGTAEPHVSPLRPPAAADCAKLHTAAFAHGWSAADFEALLADAAIVADSATCAGQQPLLGFVVSRKAADEAEVLTIAIGPQARRRGIATRLLATHLGNLAGVGVARVLLEVEDTNAAGLALYARFGFVKVGERMAYYRKSDGTRGSALILRRDLG